MTKKSILCGLISTGVLLSSHAYASVGEVYTKGEYYSQEIEEMIVTPTREDMLYFKSREIANANDILVNWLIGMPEFSRIEQGNPYYSPLETYQQENNPA